MKKRGRPVNQSAYLERYKTGYFMFEPIIEWIARDDFGNEVARAKTKKECQARTRDAGYTPRI